MDGVTVAEGDTTVPALGSVSLSATALPPGLAPGWHVLRVVADTLDAVHEMQEGNNASTRMVYLAAPLASVGAPPVTLALSEAQPNPARGAARLRLDLPRPARVEAAVFDVAGRRVWDGGDRDYSPGSWTLEWNGRSGAARAGAGLYFARVRVEGRTFIRRVVLLR
jgi:hypothetical protein